MRVRLSALVLLLVLCLTAIACGGGSASAASRVKITGYAVSDSDLCGGFTMFEDGDRQTVRNGSGKLIGTATLHEIDP
jgi:hypothetical protein